MVNHLGADGDRRLAPEVLALRRRLQTAIEATDGPQVIGRPDLGLIAYGSDSLDIFAVGEALTRRGWYVGRLSEPRGLHLMLNPVHGRSLDRYIADMQEAVAEVRAGALSARETAAIYS